MDFLKNKLFTIILVLCLVLTIFIGITANNKSNEGLFQGVITSAITPIQKQVYNAGQRIGNLFSFIKSISTLKKENTQLKAQVEELKLKLVDYQKIKAENEELNKMLQFKSDTNYNTVSANVIGKSGDNWFNIILIDVGLEDGIKKGQYVVAAEGLVGKIIEVNSKTSKVLTILDENFKIPVYINETNEDGLLVGENNNNFCKVAYLPSTTNTKPGNLVVTNNITYDIENIIPKGIIIGTVEKIEIEKVNLSNTAYIKPGVNFVKISKVQVIVNK